jgi:cysteine desulfurase
MIYLDFAASTPMRKEAVDIYTRVAEKFAANASSIHDPGSASRKVVDRARTGLAELLNAKARGIFFTGSGSEANQLALLSLAEGNKEKGRHIISTEAEHSCVRNALTLLEHRGYEISMVPLDQYGRVDPQKVIDLLRKDTQLVTIHHGNSETGTLQPIQDIGMMLKDSRTVFHSDCVQTFGKVPIDTEAMGLDSLSLSAHKVYGPKGVGATYINPSASWKPTMPGTTQEKGFRPGTANTPGIAAFLTAAKLGIKEMKEEQKRSLRLRQQLIQGLQELPYEFTFEGDPEHLLPQVIGLRIKGMEGQYAMLECNRHGLAISTGSACSVGTEKASATMVALGRDEQETREFIRLSLGKQTTEDDISKALEIIEQVLAKHFEMVRLN